jgi:hypothetical protein
LHVLAKFEMSFPHFFRKHLKQQKLQSRRCKCFPTAAVCINSTNFRALQERQRLDEESYNNEECPRNPNLGEELVIHESALEEGEKSESSSGDEVDESSSEEEEEEDWDHYSSNRDDRRCRPESPSQLLPGGRRNYEPRPNVELTSEEVPDENLAQVASWCQLQKETKKRLAWGLSREECPPQDRPQASAKDRVSIQGTSRRTSDGPLVRPSTSAAQEGDFRDGNGCGVCDICGRDSRPSPRCEQNILRWLSENRAQWNGCKDNNDAKKVQGRKQHLYESIVQLKEINRELMKDYREILRLVDINRQFIELYEAEKQAKREARRRAAQLETLMKIRSKLMGEKNHERTDPEEVSRGTRKKYSGRKHLPNEGCQVSTARSESSVSTTENDDLLNLDNYGRDSRNGSLPQNSLAISSENLEGLHRNEGKTYKGKTLKKIENRRAEVEENDDDGQRKTGKRTTARSASEVQRDNRSTNNAKQGPAPLASTSNNLSKKSIQSPTPSGRDGIVLSGAKSSRTDGIVEDRDKKISGNALPKKSTPEHSSDPEESRRGCTWNIFPAVYIGNALSTNPTPEHPPGTEDQINT